MSDHHSSTTEDDDLQRISTEDDDPEEEEEEESSDEDDDDDDENSSSLFWILQELRNSWRQHCVAIAVAVLATVLAYQYQHLVFSMNNGSSSSITKILPKQQGRRRVSTTLVSDNDDDKRHPHLQGYKRTANITFCGMIKASENKDERHDSLLEVMDFHIPKKLLDSLQQLYYDNSNHNDDDEQDNRELRCLQRLRDSSPQTYIKGVTMFYKTPKFESMYPEYQKQRQQQASVVAGIKKNKNNANQLQPAHLTFTGFAAKFVNLGNVPVLLYWDGRGEDDRGKKLVGELAPFEALSTATNRPGESFSVRPVYDHSHALARWVVTADDAVQYYEPKTEQQQQKQSLDLEQQRRYDSQKLNQEFAKHYLIHSQRTWLAHFPRAFPVHEMWPADYFGQQHKVDSSITTVVGGDGDNVDEEASSAKKTRTFTLKAESVTPRVFTIRNFLSASECDTLIQLALAQGLHGSTVYSGSLAKQQQRVTSTRSSSNTWLARDTAALTDQIYQRAAHVTKIDESLLQGSMIDDDVEAHQHSIAESLQVIRYKVKEEYTPHHDWVLPDQQHQHQPTRFATLLIYLNDDFEGGETTFPRAVNAQHHDGIKITPKKGTAVLFYNMLPDGNVDDLSQHGSEPVKSGEKFAANLWLWDPMIN